MNDVPEIASKSHLKKLISNRDYSVLINYSPPTRVLTSEYSKQIFSHDLRFLEIRGVLLSCIYISARIVKDFNVHDVKSVSSEVNGLRSNDGSLMLDELDSYLKSLKNLFVELENDPPAPVPKTVFGSFFGSQLLGLMRSKNIFAIIINFIELIQIMVSSENKNSKFTSDEWMNKMKVNVTELANKFEKIIDFCQCIISKTTNEVDSSLKLEGRKEVLEILTNMIDVSFINIIKNHDQFKFNKIVMLFSDVEYFMCISFFCNILYKKSTKPSSF